MRLELARKGLWIGAALSALGLVLGPGNRGADMRWMLASDPPSASMLLVSSLYAQMAAQPAPIHLRAPVRHIRRGHSTDHLSGGIPPQHRLHSSVDAPHRRQAF